jgi:hypothetical protein
MNDCENVNPRGAKATQQPIGLGYGVRPASTIAVLRNVLPLPSVTT